MQTWYYEVEGREHGPCTIEVIRALLAEGTLTPESRVRNQSVGKDWRKITEVPELARPKLKLATATQSTEAEMGEEPFKQLVGLVVRSLEKRRPKKQILSALVQRNVPVQMARQLIADVSRARHAKCREAGLHHISYGIGSIITGVVLTILLSHVLKVVGSGFRVVFYGLVLVGAFEVLNGLRYLVFGGR